jgi:alkyl hydroperoxide reductase subunit AhpC
LVCLGPGGFVKEVLNEFHIELVLGRLELMRWAFIYVDYSLLIQRGIIRQITINDLPVGRSVLEVIHLVGAFQFTDKYGKVCSVN